MPPCGRRLLAWVAPSSGSSTGRAAVSRASHLARFTSVDDADPGDFIGLADRLHETPAMGRARADLLAALAIGPGDRVLDLGCGPGDATRDLARRLRPGGEAVGVDRSRVLIDEAIRRQAASGLPATFEVGDARQLRFDTGTFGACRAERLLAHVPDPRAVLAEMVRVVRPGGRIGVIDVNADSLMIDHPDRVMTDVFAASLIGAVRHPNIGPQLRRLLSEAGLVDVEARPRILRVPYRVVAPLIDAHAAWMADCGIAGTAIDQWRWELDYADSSNAFFFGLPLFVAVGHKP